MCVFRSNSMYLIALIKAAHSNVQLGRLVGFGWTVIELFDWVSVEARTFVISPAFEISLR